MRNLSQAASWHLHCIEVEVCLVGSTGQTGGRAPPHADAVCGAAYLDHQPPDLWWGLGQVVVVDLAQPTTAACTPAKDLYAQLERVCLNVVADAQGLR